MVIHVVKWTMAVVVVIYVWLHLASGLSNLIWSACIILIIRTNMLPVSIH